MPQLAQSFLRGFAKGVVAGGERSEQRFDRAAITDFAERFGGIDRGFETGCVECFNEGVNGAMIAELAEHHGGAPTGNQVFVVIANGHDERAEGFFTANHTELHNGSTPLFFVKTTQISQ